MNQDPYRQPYGLSGPSPYDLKPFRDPLRRCANVMGLCLLLVQVVMMLAAGGLTLAFTPMRASLTDGAWEIITQSIDLLSYVAALGVPVILLVAWIKIPTKIAFPMRRVKGGLAFAGMSMSLGAMCLGTFAVAAVTVLLESAFGIQPIAPDLPAPAGVAASVIYFITLAVCPAILEELLFRGVILQSLRRFGDVFALVMSALLFSMSHGNLVQGISSFCLGLVSGYFALITGSLFVPILTHFVNNGLVVGSTFLIEGPLADHVELVNLGVLGLYALLGVIGLAVFFAVRGFVPLSRSSYPLTAGQKARTFFANPGQIFFLIFTIVLTLFFFESSGAGGL